jgi:hypothetical protein
MISHVNKKTIISNIHTKTGDYIMTTISANAAACKPSLFQKFYKEYKEFLPSIICGTLMLNGNTQVYPVYKALTTGKQ